VVILDLDGVSSTMLTNRKVLQLLKHQSVVDSLCFPEVMNRMIVINAPSYFAATWKVVKRWIDPRTQSKIEIYSSRSYWGKRLLELIDVDKLPSNYGGLGPSIESAILNAKSKEKPISRRMTELINVKAYSNCVVELLEDESLDVLVFTNSLMGAEFYVTPVEDGSRILEKTLVQAISAVDPSSLSDSEDDESSSVTLDRKLIAQNIVGPGKWMIHASSSKSRLSFSKEYFLVVMNITKIAMKTLSIGHKKQEKACDKSIQEHSKHLIYIKENGWIGTF
jgi:hypothetical protein